MRVGAVILDRQPQSLASRRIDLDEACVRPPADPVVRKPTFLVGDRRELDVTVAGDASLSVGDRLVIGVRDATAEIEAWITRGKDERAEGTCDAAEGCEHGASMARRPNRSPVFDAALLGGGIGDLGAPVGPR